MANSARRKTKAEKAPAGEGERRAVRGFVRQWDLSARLLYEAIAAGRLAWVGLADRGAGQFDDLVLGMTDGNVVAHQVKTSQNPDTFSLDTLMLGAPALLARQLAARTQLAARGATVIQTVLATDDIPRLDDQLRGTSGSASTAAFLEQFQLHHDCWSLEDWRASAFGGFVDQLRTASGLTDEAFLKAFRGMRFLTAGDERGRGHQAVTPNEQRRITQLAGLIPRLVAQKGAPDRWPLTDFLRELGWRDAFELRHAHQFPIDEFVQTNAEAEGRLQAALADPKHRYVSLLGPPGVGKSTLLQSGLLPTPQAVIVRYLAFVPDERHGLGRAEAFDFLSDLIAQLKQGGLGQTLIPGQELEELQAQFERLLGECSARWASEGVRTVFVVDGLDHVPREEKPRRSFLNELPLPNALPDGVAFVLGSQRLDLEGMPPSVAAAAGSGAARVDVSPLSREAVKLWADQAGLPADVGRGKLYDRTKGHPLSTRYALEALRHAETPDARAAWLTGGPAYDGDVAVFYERAWRELESDAAARKALAFVAIAEAPLRPASLDALVGRDATDAAHKAAQHLLTIDPDGGWSIFHNSFRVFLAQQATTRFGRDDPEGLRRRYAELAEVTTKAPADDPQHWMELRYRARADEQDRVSQLATQERFRSEFIAGRDVEDIRADIRFAMRTAASQRDLIKLIDLVLAQHEVTMRVGAIVDEVFDAYLAVHDLEGARGLLKADPPFMSASKPFDLVDRLFSIGAAAQARALFEQVEPLDEILGAKPIDELGQRGTLPDWARQALAFRTPAHVRASLDRLRPPLHPVHDWDMEAYRVSLKLTAVAGALDRAPRLDRAALASELGLTADLAPVVAWYAARSAWEAGDIEAARLALQAFNGDPQILVRSDRLYAAALAQRLDLPELALQLIDGLAAPTLKDLRFDYQEGVMHGAAQNILMFARIRAQLGLPPIAGEAPTEPLFTPLQARLELIGRLWGEGLARQEPHTPLLPAFRSILDYFEHAGVGGDPFDRMKVIRVLDAAIGSLIRTARAFGSEATAALADMVDGRLASGSGLDIATVRRAAALGFWEADGDSDAARHRLGPPAPHVESTPAEQLGEVALHATTLAELQLEQEARDALQDMHRHGLGYGLAAKKDGQYLFWREVFVRANTADPSRRPERLAAFGRLLAGMGETEGRNAGQRLVNAFLSEAARSPPDWANKAADLIEESNLSDWSDIVAGLVQGVVAASPSLGAAGCIVYGRIGLPWTGPNDNIPYEDLIQQASPETVEAAAIHALTCLETDAHATTRLKFIDEVRAAAAARGVDTDPRLRARWAAEAPPAEPRGNPEDRFYDVKTMAELEAVLSEPTENPGYGLTRAFERVAKDADFTRLKAVFVRESRVRNDVHSVAAFTRAAIAVGADADATAGLEFLRPLAEEAHSWTYWRSEAARHYYELDVLKRGAAARADAFDALASGLAEGREDATSLIPDLPEALDVISEIPPWSEIWDSLARQLAQFRELQLADAVVPPPPGDPDGVEILARLLLRAAEVGATALARGVRVVAAELTPVPSGRKVVGRLVDLMLGSVARVRVDGLQIAWELRDQGFVWSVLAPRLDALQADDDYAIRKGANDLARHWAQPVKTVRRPLPGGYDLLVPDTAQSRKFEPPSGSSQYSSGLWMSDPLSLTFALGFPLEILEEASGIPLPTLRARVALKMQALGDAAAYGPDADKKLRSRYIRLSLHGGFTKLVPAASMVAFRRVLGELAAADRVDRRALPTLLIETGAYPPKLRTQAPGPRPAGVSAPGVVDHMSSTDPWPDLAADDLLRPRVDGWCVLAATASFERRQFQDQWDIDRYFGYGVTTPESSVHRQRAKLPTVFFGEDFEPLYTAPSRSGVAELRDGIASALPSPGLCFCPRLAAACGWISDAEGPLRWRDVDGQVMAETRFWRDGGIASENYGRTWTGEGCLVAVAEAGFAAVAEHLEGDPGSFAWRQAVVGGSRRSSTAPQPAPAVILRPTD